ncbi:hypothetical protein CgunFtcFv8_025079 [Champsocephalus gunnari]|uniref:Uncharacterized protein n=1 Tax=Champsocephalus gunnari TaxID=52237 RepID=A0AAN8HRF1_CHAGU|nr:hypothetical protein CgunFtcFv8_025079 [Champsocephalus gunnari]
MWLQRHLEILKTHYSDLLTVLSVDLPPFRSDAFDRAIIWARKRYHNKLTPSSISALHSLLNSSDPPPSTPPLDITNPISFPSLPLPQRPHRLPSVPPRLPNTLTLPLNIPCLLSLSFPHRPPYYRPPPRPCGKDAPPPTSGRTRPRPPSLLPIPSGLTPPPTSGQDLHFPIPPASPLPSLSSHIFCHSPFHLFPSSSLLLTLQPLAHPLTSCNSPFSSGTAHHHYPATVTPSTNYCSGGPSTSSHLSLTWPASSSTYNNHPPDLGFPAHI